MLRKALGLAAFIMTSGMAQGADILVLAPGSARHGLELLADEWKAVTGNNTTIQPGFPGVIRDKVAGGGQCDLVVFPPSDFKVLAPVIKGDTLVFVGSVLMAAVVKTGTPHPDISSLPRFIAVLKDTGVGYADPSAGSASGEQVAKMLARPEFAAVKGIVTKGSSQSAVARGEVPLGISPLSESKIAGVDVIGIVPAALGMQIDISAAVCGKTLASAEALAFLKFITRPESDASWDKGDLIRPKK